MKCGNCGEEMNLLLACLLAQGGETTVSDLCTCASMEFSGLCVTCVEEPSAVCDEGELVRK